MSSLNKRFHKALNIEEPKEDNVLDIESLYNEYENCTVVFYKPLDSKVNQAYSKLYEDYKNDIALNPSLCNAIKQLAAQMYELGHADGYAEGFNEGNWQGYHDGFDDGCDYYW